MITLDTYIKGNLDKYDEYRLWFDAVFSVRKQKCSHLVKGTEFESVNTTAWRRIGAFEKCREVCTQCGKTVRVLIRKRKEA